MLVALYSSAPQSGKTEVAKVLTSHGFIPFKFAGALKDMLRSLLRSAGRGEIDIEEVIDGDRKEEPLPEFGGRTSRYMQQTLGTDWGRNLISPYLWTDLLALRVRHALKSGRHVVVDDMRFPNEFDLLRGLGGILVWVQRPGVVARTTHPSEGLLDTKPFDKTIVNSGTLSTLRSTVYDILL